MHNMHSELRGAWPASGASGAAWLPPAPPRCEETQLLWAGAELPPAKADAVAEPSPTTKAAVKATPPGWPHKDDASGTPPWWQYRASPPWGALPAGSAADPPEIPCLGAGAAAPAGQPDHHSLALRWRAYRTARVCVHAGVQHIDADFEREHRLQCMELEIDRTVFMLNDLFQRHRDVDSCSPWCCFSVLLRFSKQQSWSAANSVPVPLATSTWPCTCRTTELPGPAQTTQVGAGNGC